jgi:hypothetical protein
MPDSDRLPKPWNSFLRQLDAIATEPVEFHCIGGFVMTRKFGFARETVDVLTITPKQRTAALRQHGSRGSDLHKKYRIYLDVVGVVHYYPESSGCGSLQRIL